jgi:hypothetical protein
MRLIHAGPPSLVRIALAAGAVSAAYAHQQTEPTGDFTLPPPKVAHGIPFGPFHLPVDSLCSPVLGYTGTTLVGKASRLARDLDKVRDCRGRVVLQLARKKMLDDAGQLSVQAAREELETWRDAADIRSYLRDTTVFAIYIGDDIKSKEWGIADSALRLARFDSIAGVVKSFWGDSATTILRAPPTSMTGHAWRWVDAAWAQYDGPYRDGPPEKYRDTEVASAKAQKLGLVLWFNALDGGCGPVSRGACLPKVPGTPIYGTYSDTTIRRYQVSSAEAGYYGAMFLAEPYNCAAIQWQWSPVWNGHGRPPEQVAGIQAFDLRADVRAQMRALSVMAKSRPYAPCRRR